MGVWIQRAKHCHPRLLRTQRPTKQVARSNMDAIRKKMQSLKGETDSLYATIQKFEDATKESNRLADQADCDIRDYGKKVHSLEIEFDETNDKLQKATESLERRTNTIRRLSPMCQPFPVELCSWRRK